MDTSLIIACSIAVAAVAFAVLCVFLISTLKTAQRSLASARSAVEEVKETIEGLQGEVRKLAETINDVTTDVKGKLQATNPLFDAVQDLGLVLRDVTGTARQASRHLTHAVRRQAAAIETGVSPIKWARWIALGSRVISGLRKGWKEQSSRERERSLHGLDSEHRPVFEEDKFEQLRH